MEKNTLYLVMLLNSEMFEKVTFIQMRKRKKQA